MDIPHNSTFHIPYLGRFLIQWLGRFLIWQLFLPTAVKIISATSYFCIAEIVACGKYISTHCFIYSGYLHSGYLFQAGDPHVL